LTDLVLGGAHFVHGTTNVGHRDRQRQCSR
jgi:hypothetical protein